MKNHPFLSALQEINSYFTPKEKQKITLDVDKVLDVLIERTSCTEIKLSIVSPSKEYEIILSGDNSKLYSIFHPDLMITDKEADRMEEYYGNN